MAKPLASVILLPTTSKVYFQVELPGVPWYIYHDRFDSYRVKEDSNLSCLVLDLAADTSNGGIILGSAIISLLGATDGTATSTTQQAGDPKWTKLDGLRGWHRSPGSVESFVYYVGQGQPSTYYRSVLADGEYNIQISPAGYRLSVKVKSVIGEGDRDGNTEEYGRNQIPEGQCAFDLSVAKSNGSENGWEVVGVEGVEMQA